MRDLLPPMRRALSLDLCGATEAAVNEMEACLDHIREAQGADWRVLASEICVTPLRIEMDVLREKIESAPPAVVA